MKKVVLFDMDGVIVNTEGKHYAAWKTAFDLEGIFLSKRGYKTNIQSQGRKKGINNMIPNVSEETLNRISKNKSLYYEEYIKDGVEVYSDAFLLIKALAETDIILGVVSSSSYARYILEKIQLKDYFSIIIAGTEGLNIENKPEPDIYELAIKKLGISSDEVLIIEDSVSGIKAGLKANCTVVGIEREKLNIKDDNLIILKTLDYKIISHIIN